MVGGVTNCSYFFELLYTSRRHDDTVERLRWKLNRYEPFIGWSYYVSLRGEFCSEVYLEGHLER